MKVLFEGEKTNLFWVGLVIFGFSLYLFLEAIWELLYLPFIYPYISGTGNAGNAGNILFNLRLEALANVPIFIGGIIFVIIGIYIMKAGIKKNQLPNPTPS